MIDLEHDRLSFRFPEVHSGARLTLQFQRTLRIPDDGDVYPLPPGLGAFPLRHVDDFTGRLPEMWERHGGVMLPMYQSEALWLQFHGRYPFAIKVATGKINAITGERWSEGLHRDPQDYMVTPDQPWLDGYSIEKGKVRQFVAMPLGSGYSVEEQVTGEARHGGLQVVAYPMKASAYARWREKTAALGEGLIGDLEGMVCFTSSAEASEKPVGMSLAPGGTMRQEIFEDAEHLEDWDTRNGSRCFVHIANSLTWRAITGEAPPATPLTAREYADYGMPWFDYYGGDRTALAGSTTLKSTKSVREIGEHKGDTPLPENESVKPGPVIKLKAADGKPVRVREGEI